MTAAADIGHPLLPKVYGAPAFGAARMSNKRGRLLRMESHQHRRALAQRQGVFA